MAQTLRGLILRRAWLPSFLCYADTEALTHKQSLNINMHAYITYEKHAHGLDDDIERTSALAIYQTCKHAVFKR